MVFDGNSIVCLCQNVAFLNKWFLTTSNLIYVLWPWPLTSDLKHMIYDHTQTHNRLKTECFWRANRQQRHKSIVIYVQRLWRPASQIQIKQFTCKSLFKTFNLHWARRSRSGIPRLGIIRGQWYLFSIHNVYSIIKTEIYRN